MSRAATTAPSVTVASPGPAGPAHEEQPHQWIAFGVVLVAAFMVLVDVTITVVATPSIQRDLHATFGQTQLIIALYLLAYAVMLVTGGRLGDIYGRRHLLCLGMLGFVVASAACGLAQSPEMLLVSRVVQGFAAALMYPQVLSFIQISLPAKDRGRAFAIFGAVIGLATVSGLLLSGALIQWSPLGLSWRAIFLVNVPLGLTAALAACFLVRNTRAPKRTRLDIIGVLTVSMALLLLVWPLVEGREAGWPLWALACLAAAGPAFIVFALLQARKTRHQKAPLIDLNLFRHRSFSIGLIVVLTLLAGIASLVLTLALYLQFGLGFDAMRTGLTEVPFSFGIALGSALSARLVARWGRGAMIAGSSLMVVGMSATTLIINALGADLDGWELIPSLFVAGAGFGTVFAPLFKVVVSGLPAQFAGAASGVLSTVHQIGNAVGVAVIGVIFFGLLSAYGTAVGHDSGATLSQELVAAGLPQSRASGIATGFERCFADRMAESDPEKLPASCNGTRPPAAIAPLLADTAVDARKTDMTRALVPSLGYVVGVYLLTALLLVFLPVRSVPAGAPVPAGTPSRREGALPSLESLPAMASAPPLPTAPPVTAGVSVASPRVHDWPPPSGAEIFSPEVRELAGTPVGRAGRPAADGVPVMDWRTAPPPSPWDRF